MDLIKKIESIETPKVRDLEWYYHSFYFEEERFKDMLTEGLKCRKLLSLEPAGNNGNYYISLIKDLGIVDLNYGFDGFMKVATSFIISGINPVKCSTSMYSLYHVFANTKIALRTSGWEDEFQELLRISPTNFVGIHCPLYNWVLDAMDESLISDFTFDFISLKKMIEITKEYGHTLPIYDYSRREGKNVHLIDSNLYLEKCDEIVEDVRVLTKTRSFH